MPLGDLSVAKDRQAAWLSAGTTCLILSALFYLIAPTTADPDLWGHVRFGLDIWQSGTIAEQDPYSYLTAGQRWINHEWLAEVLFGRAFALAGGPGLILLKTAIGLALLGLLYRYLALQGLDALRAGMVLIVVVFVLRPGLGTVRPQLFSYLFFLLILLLIRRAEEGGPRWLWGALPVFALWANFHGGFLAGLAALLLWSGAYLGALVWRTRQPALLLSGPAWGVVLAAAGCVLATLLNPYGPGLLTFLLRTATVPRPEIVEWQPLSLLTPVGAAYVLLLAASGLGLAYSGRKRRPASVVLLAAMALLPLAALRHVPLAALALVVLAGDHLAAAWNRWSPAGWSGHGEGGSWRFRPGFAALSLGGAVLFVISALPCLGCVRLDPKIGFRFPSRAVALLKASGVHGNLAVFFTWGEYVIWYLGPEIQVSMDGRRETIYAEDVYRENLQFLNGVGDWDALLEKRPTQLVLVHRDYPVYNLMKLKPGWLLLYEDSLSGLFVRQGLPLVEQIRKTEPPDLPADGAGLCFSEESRQ